MNENNKNFWAKEAKRFLICLLIILVYRNMDIQKKENENILYKNIKNSDTVLI